MGLAPSAPSTYTRQSARMDRSTRRCWNASFIAARGDLRGSCSTGRPWMPDSTEHGDGDLMSRRTVIGAAAATVGAAGVAAAQTRVKGPRVFLDMDQNELDDAYDQSVYAPNR